MKSKWMIKKKEIGPQLQDFKTDDEGARGGPPGDGDPAHAAGRALE